MTGFIDIHQHLLPGLDDGAQDEEEMAQLLQADAESGIERIIATPHTTPGYEPLDEKAFVSALKATRAYSRESELNIRIYPGSEILYTPGLRNAVQNGRIVTLNKTNYVLIEFMPTADIKDINDGVECLVTGGYIPVIAHVERYENLFKSYSRMSQLKTRYDLLYQVNCSTIIQPRGLMTKMTLNKCLSNRLIDFVSTDAHNLNNRRPNMRAAYEVLTKQVGAEYADQLCGNNAERYLLHG